MKLRFLYIVLTISFSVYGQDLSQRALQKLDDESLLELFNEVSPDSLKTEVIARIYLERAKKEKDTIMMARGYDRLARIFHPEKNIQFADSIIELTKSKDHITYPALGYILKGYAYGEIRNIEYETENFLKAYELSLKNNNVSQQLYVTDRLIFLKSVWGNKREALSLQKKRNKILYNKNYKELINKSTRESAKGYYIDTHLEDEIYSILNFSFCYLKLKDLDSSKIYLNEGLKKCKQYTGYNKESLTLLFLELSVEINYYLLDYKKSLFTSDSLLNSNSFKNNINSIQNLYLFKGLSHVELKNYQEGIKYLKISDSIFEANDLIISQPYQRILFEKLLEHYTRKKDIDKRIKYLNKLIYADSIIKKNYQYFEPELIKRFETPLLINEKEQLIAVLKRKNKMSNTAIYLSLGLLLITLMVLGYNLNRQKKYKKRFDQLMLDTNNGLNKPSSSSNITISNEIIEDILKKLDQFENNEKFLSQKVSLMGLAREFGTNHKYLSRIINLNKEKHFSNYINDLRVKYAFKELKSNSKFRNFTIKAIAFDCGFNNPNSFNKAFYKVYEIYPSYYIKKLESKKMV